MTMKKLGIGILGLGEGRSTMSAALQSDCYDLITICDRNEELCRQRANEFGFNNWTTEYDDMLNDPRIDVIGIYTPDHLHSNGSTADCRIRWISSAGICPTSTR